MPFTSNSVVLSAFFSLPNDDWRRESAPSSFMDKVSCSCGVFSRGLFCNWYWGRCGPATSCSIVGTTERAGVCSLEPIYMIGFSTLCSSLFSDCER